MKSSQADMHTDLLWIVYPTNQWENERLFGIEKLSH